jgi:tRNA (guanine37-N1)-methyltransferase
MVIRVELAGSDEAATVAAVAAETFPLACPPGTPLAAIADFVAEHLSQERFEAYLADPSRSVLLATVDGEPAGYTMLVHGDAGDADVARALAIHPTVELSKCYVRAGFHGAGVAAALMRASFDAGRSRGASGIWLGVNQHNARAIRFYEKSGYARVGTKTFLIGGEPQDDFVYERALA